MSVTCKVSWTRSEIAGSKLSLHVFPSSLFPLFLPFTSPVLSLSLSFTCIYKTDTHIYIYIHTPNMQSHFSSSLAYIPQIIQVNPPFPPTNFPLSVSSPVGPQHPISDWLFALSLTGSLTDPIFSLAPAAFQRRKTERLLSIMKYWTAVSTSVVITANYDVRRSSRGNIATNIEFIGKT